MIDVTLPDVWAICQLDGHDELATPAAAASEFNESRTFERYPPEYDMSTTEVFGSPGRNV